MTIQEVRLLTNAFKAAAGKDDGFVAYAKQTGLIVKGFKPQKWEQILSDPDNQKKFADSIYKKHPGKYQTYGQALEAGRRILMRFTDSFNDGEYD